MRINKLTPIIASLVVLAVITAILVRYHSVKAQQDRAAGTPISAKVALQQTEGDGFNLSPAAETKSETNADLTLDADEVERRAREEQTTTAATVSPIPISFKHVALPVLGGIDYAVAGVATRNSGEGVIRMRGVPPGSQFLGALLVWGEISAGGLAAYNVGFGQDCAVLANVVGSPASFPTNPAPQPCWNPAGQFWAYLAPVPPAQIAPGINGDYRIKGLRTAIRNGRCPWGDGACPGPGNALPLSEGASLIVFYANQCIPRNARIFLNLGPQTFFGLNTNNHITGPIPGLATLKHSRIGADGQVGVSNCGLRSIPQISDERTFIGSIPGFGNCRIQIKGDVGGLNRDSDWNGYDGEPLNKLWDTHTDVFSNCLAGQLGYQVQYQAQGDCIVWVVHILGVK